MRTLVIAALAAMAMAMPGAAEAQRIDSGPHGGWTAGSPPPAGSWQGGQHWNGGARPMPGPNVRHSRWGGRAGGYWYGGTQAPGGWSAYRPMKRGRTLPRYWISPSFYIGDWNNYGLRTPPPGYFWSRYYNDAVLIDQYGRVYDAVPGVNWDGYGAYDEGYDMGSPPPAYGAPYPAPYTTSSSQGGVTTTTTTTVAGGGYASAAPLVIPAGTVATITMPGAVTTTTTTEYIEEHYAPAARVVKRVYRAPVKRRVVRARPKVRCCVCGCR